MNILLDCIKITVKVALTPITFPIQALDTLVNGPPLRFITYEGDYPEDRTPPDDLADKLSPSLPTEDRA